MVFALPNESYLQWYHCGGAFLFAYLPNTSDFESEHSLAISGCSRGKIAYKWREERLDKATISPQDWDVLCNFYADHFYNSTICVICGWKALFGDCYLVRPTSTLYDRMGKRNNAESLFMADLHMALEHNSPPDRFLQQLLYRMQDNSLYLTDRGDLVNASKKVMVGDEVFVARGLSCAMIVRQVSEAKAKEAAGEAAHAKIHIREFVAGAYVEGIMDGEAIKKVDDGEVEEMQVLLV